MTCSKLVEKPYKTVRDVPSGDLVRNILFGNPDFVQADQAKDLK